MELLATGYRVVVLDNLDNSSTVALDRVRQISKCADEEIILAEADLLDLPRCELLFERFGPFDACIHFAGLKAVGESVTMPLHYYQNNLTGTLNLIHLLDKYACRAVAFSSSATVYGEVQFNPLTETHPLGSTNPYGRTKEFIEHIFNDVDKSAPGKWSIALLRYFNPIGAHPSGLIGEDPKGIPNNLIPYVSQVAVGRLKELAVFGDDWPTPDGTGVRDYVHVVDLAKGHVAAIAKVLASPGMGSVPWNLGTGKGTSVLEIVAAMEKASGNPVPYKIGPRRAGDIAECWAEPAKALEELGWAAEFTIEEMIADTWRWQSKNPNGFRTDAEVKAQETSGPDPRKCLVFDMYDQSK